MAWKGDTLHDLERQMGMEQDSLVNTVNTYNNFCAAGNDGQFGKASRYLAGVGSGPYYAIKIMCVIFATSGGLDVDTQIRVLKSDHKTPIYGLYAMEMILSAFFSMGAQLYRFRRHRPGVACNIRPPGRHERD
jgi:fumarate reductase flavoprotein subunit